MKVNSLIIALLSIMTLAASCKKDELSKSEIISTGTWSPTSTIEDEDGAGSAAGIETIETCEKDDVYTFKAGGVFTTSPGPSKCEPDETEEIGSWALTVNDTELVITQGLGISFKIVELTETSLKMSLTNFLDPTDPSITTYSFKKN